MSLRALLTAAVTTLTLVGLACRDQPTLPTPRLVGEGTPATAPAPRDDGAGLGGAGLEEVPDPPSDDSLPPAPPPDKPTQVPSPRTVR